MGAADYSVMVQLTALAAGKVFVGRSSSKGKVKITSVTEFNRKMKYVRKASNEGCPFAGKVIANVNRRIDTMASAMNTKIKVLSNKQYSNSVEQRNQPLEVKSILIQVSHYDSCAMKMMNLLVIYDQLNLLLIMDGMKRTGKKRLVQEPMLKIRRKIRACINHAIEYEDFGYRLPIADSVKSQESYRKMRALYGEEINEENTENVMVFT